MSGLGVGRFGGWVVAGLVVVCGACGVVVGSASADGCVGLFPAQPVRAALSVGLPDCRAYEQVNPVFKGGGNLVPIAVSRDGDTVVYAAFAAFTGSSGGDREVVYQARRTAGGWRSVSFYPSSTAYFTGGPDGIPTIPYDASADLHKIFIGAFDNPNYGVARTGSPNFYIFTPDGVDGCVTSDGGGCAVNTTPSGGLSALAGLNITSYVGASGDLGHLFFDSSLLVAGDPTVANNTGLAHDLVEDYNVGSASAPAYRYRLVGLDNSGDPLGLISTGGTELGSGAAGSNEVDRAFSYHSEFQAVSGDGSRVFFTAKAHRQFDFSTFTLSEHPSVDELFMRVNGTVTVPVSVPSVSSCQTADELSSPVSAFCDPTAHPDGALFEGASADGSRVYFTTTQPEVAGVTDTTTNLYAADVSGSAVTRMTRVSAGDVSGGGAQVQGVVRISRDGSHVYFVAQGVLTGVPGPGGVVAQAGADNLYVFDAVTGQTRFVAVLPVSEAALWGTDDHREAQTTPDGRYLVFDSAAQLTADDSDTAVDVFRYDSQEGTLVRVSGGNAGYDGDGNNSAFPASIAAPNYAASSFGAKDEVVESVSNARESVSDDGSTVFFLSGEGLQADDLNGAPDVYEWRGGRVSLVSDGMNPDTVPPAGAGLAGATGFVGSSASGGDAFFQSTSVLTPDGGDGAYDLFDARVGGGFSVAPSPADCSGDACRGPLSVAPSGVAAGGSATTAGGGNVPAPKAAVVKKPVKKAKPKKAKKKKKAKAKAKSKARKGSRARRAKARVRGVGLGADGGRVRVGGGRS